VDLVAPSGPARALFARKEIQIRTGAVSFDPAVGFVRLAAVFANRRDDQLPHILCESASIATTGEQADLNVVARRESESDAWRSESEKTSGVCFNPRRSFTQAKPIAEYLNPHALITSKTRWRFGPVVHKNRWQPEGSTRSRTGRAAISSMVNTG
jgi:hypothetical protein